MPNAFKLLFLAALLAGCATNGVTAPGNVGREVISQGPITFVVMPETVTVGDTLTFRTAVQIPELCWKFDHFDIQSTDTVKVKAFIRRPDTPCLAAVGSVVGTGQVYMATPGLQHFSFVSRDTNIVRTVMVRPQ